MTWDQIRLEIHEASQNLGVAQHDNIRRAKIATVEKISSIPLIVYAADFTDIDRAAQYGAGLQIQLQDKTGFLQAISDIPDGPLDVLLHSPGGSPTATESIVHLLRARFDPIRFLIPHTSKSAATMLALSGNEVLLGEAAELGPIDPQLQFVTEQRPVTVPARAAIDQFERAGSDISTDPTKLRVWLPIIRQYGPGFLQECHNAIELSETLVTDWLSRYMFSGDPDASTKAERIAKWLADHNNFNSHSRPVWIEQLLELEPLMRVGLLGDLSKQFEDAVMALYWAIDVTFNDTDAIKLIEHRQGSAYIQLRRKAVIAPSIPSQPSPPPNSSPPQNRAQRRQQKKGKR